MEIRRFRWVGGVLLGVAALALALTPDVDAARSRRQQPRIGLQLYSVRDDCARDLPGVLKAVAAMGYQGVEFAGYYGRSAEELRKLLDENGLVCCGTHIGLETLLGDQFEATVRFNKTLGNKFLIVPGLPAERTASRQAWLETARLFNEIAKKLEPHGMYVGYHNHTVEFKPLDNELPWDTFFGNTDKRVVMQFDTGNALAGGAEAAPFLRRYPGRALTVHIKEHSATNDKALVGEGDVKWAEILSLLRRTANTEWYIIEQESYAYPPLECVEKCLRNFEKLLAQQRR
ncbi:MAG: sugar phosphate isomerase/epimerase [Armatimonadetes bacterium]|jgi:sugar phosphate isomerase/epimerase|nr:sugar phosphate isomerase/epimerase [Armatimonadota bacterium]